MILRYSVETKFSRSFTASKKVKDLNHAINSIKLLQRVNKKVNHTQYNNFVVYTDNDLIIKRY